MELQRTELSHRLVDRRGPWRLASRGRSNRVPRDLLERQYRLHEHAIEAYLNTGATRPIVGYFSFVFRDWQAPTWGVVDAPRLGAQVTYRSYLESNHPVRVTLPHAQRGR